MNDIPGPGKFEGNPSDSLSHYLYEMSPDEFFGTVDDVGFWGILRWVEKSTTKKFLKEEFGTEPTLYWHYIINESPQGFFTYSGYDDLEVINIVWEKMVHELSPLGRD